MGTGMEADSQKKWENFYFAAKLGKVWFVKPLKLNGPKKSEAK